MRRPRNRIGYWLAFSLSFILLVSEIGTAKAMTMAFAKTNYSRMEYLVWLPAKSPMEPSGPARAQEELRPGPVEIVGPQTQLQPLIGTPVASGYVEEVAISNTLATMPCAAASGIAAIDPDEE